MLLLQRSTEVVEVMSQAYLSFSQTDRVNQVLQAMLERAYHEAVVVDQEKLVGLIFCRDLIKMLNDKGEAKREIKGLISQPVAVVSPEQSIQECKDLMEAHQVELIPVVKEGVLLGIVREKDINESFYARFKEYYEQLSRVIESLHEAVCVTDKNGVVIVWNKSSERLYNTKKEEILGAHIGDFFPNAMSLKVLKSKKPIWNVYHSPRENFHVILSTEPIFLDGEFIGVVSTDRDVTEMEELSHRLDQATSTVKFLEKQVKKFTRNGFDSIIGKSDLLTQKIRMAEQVAATEATILISGESGTGKEVFARAIHEASGRKGLFIPLNCSAIPAGLFESELFGYVEGAFTGARKSGKMGVFEMADRGTVFLDEIGEMPLHMQAKLLRVLQEKEIQRVGSEKVFRVETRVISATNKELKEMVKEGKFREDLYYRLNVVEIQLPPLRNRPTDITLLVAQFFKELCQKEKRAMPYIEPEVMEILENYTWEGNVRQLKNTVEYLWVMSQDDVISVDRIPGYIRNEMKGLKIERGDSLDITEAVQRVERDIIERALSQANGSRAKAAKLLNIPRTTLYYKLQLYGFNKGDEK